MFHQVYAPLLLIELIKQKKNPAIYSQKHMNGSFMKGDYQHESFHIHYRL